MNNVESIKCVGVGAVLGPRCGEMRLGVIGYSHC